MQGRQLLLVLLQLLPGLVEFGGGGRDGLLVSLELGIELGKLLLAELDGLLLLFDLGLHGAQLLIGGNGRVAPNDRQKNSAPANRPTRLVFCEITSHPRMGKDYFRIIRGLPVISGGTGRPIRVSMVGARLDSLPPSATSALRPK